MILLIDERTAHLIEVKWKDLNKKDTERVLHSLEGKSKLVRSNGTFKLGLIARKVEEKEDLRAKGYPIWDLEDILSQSP